MNNYLYPFFWQHGEDHEVLGEYMDKIYHSGMKGICVEARPHPDFVGEGWWKDMDFILERARQLDMKVWILDDSHFPTGYANGKIQSDYPQYLKKYLDMRRYDVQGPLKGARIDFSLLKGRPWDKPDKEQKILKVLMAKRTTQETTEGDPVVAETMIDITSNMNMDNRLLTLDIPEGAYSIFVVYTTRKGGEDATKDYLNPLIREATEVLLQEVYEPHYLHYKEEFGKTIEGFFSDEPRFGNEKGTEARIGKADMVLPWREGLENEIGFDAKYLPLLWVDAEGFEKDIRFQYMDTVTKLYNENFTKVLGDWCREHNVFYLGHTIEDNGAHARLGYGTGHYFRGQQDMDFAGIDVIGSQIVPGMNYHHDAFSTGGSNGEFYHYALAKLASSAAHLDPKKKGRAMCEAFGAYGWNEGLKMMKWITDHLLVRGINYFVPHAFNPKKFPDFDCPPHFYAHGHNPQFRYYKVFSDYTNRISNIFRDGIYPSSIGVLYPAEQEWGGEYMPVEKVCRELTIHQIPYDIVTRDFLKEAKIENGTFVINGHPMKNLVIPYAQAIPADLMKILKEMLENNIKVYFVNEFPEILLGFPKTEDVFEYVKQHSKVILKEHLGKILEPFQNVTFSEEQKDLVVGEYEKQGKRYYMIFNENIAQTTQTQIKIKNSRYVYQYDAFSGKTYALMKDSDTGMYDISLTPYESIVLIESDQMEDTEALRADENSEKEQISLNEKWMVTFADSISYPEFQETVPVEEICCIQEIPGWEKKAGTVRFSTTISCNDVKCAEIDLGEVFETAEVFVNGTSAGVRLCRPYKFDLSGLLHDGENELAIEVTNTLGTAIREPVSHYLMIEPFGIEGPVSLIKRNERGEVR